MFIKRLAALSLAVASIVAMPALAKQYTNQDLLVSAQDLMQGSAGQTVLIDVRTEEDYLKGHIPGAVRIDPNAVAAPYSPIDGALKPISQIAEMFGELGVGPDTRVVLYDDKGGFHAARMFWVLEYLGHSNVALLDGGLTAWKDEDGALESGAVARALVRKLEPALTPRRFASADWILERRDEEETIVIDVRPPALWAKGHIPWALNIPWKGNLRADKTMKPEAALLAHFAAMGVTPDKDIVIHCQNGLASAHSYFALRLIGFPRVRTYHRSWSEWGSSDDLPTSSKTEG